MTHTNLDLQKMGLIPLNTAESRATNGGGILKWIGETVAAAIDAPEIAGALVIIGAADAIADFSKGVVEGWNSVK